MALTELTPDACKIEFELSYEFAGGVFDKVANSVVERDRRPDRRCFARRAESFAR